MQLQLDIHKDTFTIWLELSASEGREESKIVSVLQRIVVWMLRASIHHNVLTPTGSAQGGDQGPTEGVVGSVHKYLASSLSTNK